MNGTPIYEELKRALDPESDPPATAGTNSAGTGMAGTDSAQQDDPEPVDAATDGDDVAGPAGAAPGPAPGWTVPEDSTPDRGSHRHFD